MILENFPMNEMTAQIQWLKNNDINFKTTSGSGHDVIVDSKQTLGARPMELHNCNNCTFS